MEGYAGTFIYHSGEFIVVVIPDVGELIVVGIPNLGEYIVVGIPNVGELIVVGIPDVVLCSIMEYYGVLVGNLLWWAYQM